MVGERKTAECCVALLLLASAAGQASSPAPCPNAIPQKSANLTIKQKLVTALFAAVEDDDLRAVKRLLAQHADANARDPHCSTPLMFAGLRDDTGVAGALAGRGAHGNG